MIFDAHAHLDVSEIRGWYDTADRLIKVMDSVGIEKSVVSAYRDCPSPEIESPMEFLSSEVKKYPERLYPFIRLNPRFDDQTIEILDIAIQKHNFRGVKLHPSSYNLYPGGEPTVKIFRRAAKYDVPILVHCADEGNSMPLEFLSCIEQSPETKVILAHSGGFFHLKDAIRVCKQYENVYMDTCESPFVDGIKKAIDEIGPDRILFGTDNPIDNPYFEIEKVKQANLGKEIEEKIFYSNIASLLKEEA
ncbi:amidohydrolase family protein [Lentibacillus daqui]|uniref:amidohydrolase family protein n=1 Tax=Lentibacillus daqui TaxID=2911514 RepID=UPI0022B144F9|nr:amidohydrolase family protein [Lentibacillus daqui]